MRPIIRRRVVAFAILLLGIGVRSSAPARAETRTCLATITSVPYAITAEGVYCLGNDVFVPASFTTGAAIDIQTSNVVLDLNGHRIDGSPAGAGTLATGVYAWQKKDVVIKNGIVRGFFYGIVLDDAAPYTTARANTVQSIVAESNTYLGIATKGRGNVVRNNSVVSTGGSTALGANANAYGIWVTGSGSRVVNNSIATVSKQGGGVSWGIFVDGSSTDAFVVNNRISDVDRGVEYVGTGKQRGNLAPPTATATATPSPTVTPQPTSSPTPSPSPTPSNSNLPIGFYDGFNCSSMWGWACDRDRGTQSLDVHFYDGSTWIGYAAANGPRSDLGPLCGGIGPDTSPYSNHVFSFPVPSALKDGVRRAIGAYAINIDSNGVPGGGNPSLGSSPIWLTCWSTPQTVLLVVGTTPIPAGSGDAAIYDRLVALGHNVVVKRDFDTQLADATGKNLIVISASTTDSNVNGRLSGVPVLASGSGTVNAVSSLNIVLPSHPIASLQSGTVAITSSNQSLRWDTAAQYATDCVAIDAAGHCLIAAYEQKPWNFLRHVYYFMGATTPTALTSDGWKLFDASVAWLMDPRPSADAGGPYQATINLPLTFSSEKSLARRGSIASYSWDFGDASTGTGSTPQHVYTALGSYNVTLTITDTQGRTASATTTVTVAPNQPPTLRVTVSSPSCHAPCTQTFTGYATDPEGELVDFTWGGCAAGQTGVRVSCSQATAGAATAILTGTTPSNAPVTVQASFVATNSPPTVHILPQGASRQVLIVTGPLGISDPADVAIANRLGQLGYSVSTVQSRDVHVPDQVTAQTAGMALVVISGTSDPDQTSPNFRSLAVPIMVSRAETLQPMSMSTAPSSLVTSQLSIVNTTHPLAAGLSGLVQASTPGTSFNFSTPAATATVIANATNGSPAIFAYDTWQGMVNDFPAVARRVGFFMAGSTPVALTDSGWRLFDAAVLWLASPETPSCTVPCSVSFTALGMDTDGDSLAYEWSGCAVGQSGPFAQCTLEAAGTFTATVTATDGRGGVGTVSMPAIGVAAGANIPPTASVGGPYSATVGQWLTFDGRASRDVDGSIAQYTWNFGDGAVFSAPTVPHAYAAPGTYTVWLFVTDNQGATASASSTVTITPNLDTDGDGLSDAMEAQLGSNPNDPDTNHDGVPDGVAYRLGLSLTSNDTDGDGVTNAVEIAQGTDPIKADTDGDGVPDGQDCFPLDPTRSQCLSGSAGDTTPPAITLERPADAVVQ